MVRVCESNASWKLSQRERVEKQKQRGRGWKTEETNKKRREEKRRGSRSMKRWNVMFLSFSLCPLVFVVTDFINCLMHGIEIMFFFNLFFILIY